MLASISERTSGSFSPVSSFLTPSTSIRQCMWKAVRVSRLLVVFWSTNSMYSFSSGDETLVDSLNIITPAAMRMTVQKIWNFTPVMKSRNRESLPISRVLVLFFMMGSLHKCTNNIQVCHHMHGRPAVLCCAAGPSS